MQTVMSGLGILRRFGQKLGPYLMLEILLPGGTLVALLLFLYQRRKFDIGRVASRTAVAMTRTFASIAGQGIFVLRPCYLQPRHAFLPGARDGLRSADNLRACPTSVFQCWAPPYDYRDVRHPWRSTTIRSEP